MQHQQAAKIADLVATTVKLRSQNDAFAKQIVLILL
jgi:hypothetical protein